MNGPSWLLSALFQNQKHFVGYNCMLSGMFRCKFLWRNEQVYESTKQLSVNFYGQTKLCYCIARLLHVVWPSRVVIKPVVAWMIESVERSVELIDCPHAVMTSLFESVYANSVKQKEPIPSETSRCLFLFSLHSAQPKMNSVCFEVWNQRLS
jgi:hypothetical protein